MVQLIIDGVLLRRRCGGVGGVEDEIYGGVMAVPLACSFVARSFGHSPPKKTREERYGVKSLSEIRKGMNLMPLSQRNWYSLTMPADQKTKIFLDIRRFFVWTLWVAALNLESLSRYLV